MKIRIEVSAPEEVRVPPNNLLVSLLSPPELAILPRMDLETLFTTTPEDDRTPERVFPADFISAPEEASVPPADWKN